MERFATTVVQEREGNVDEVLVLDVIALAPGRLSFTARGLLAHLTGTGTARHQVDQLVAESGTPRAELLRAARELEAAGLVRVARAEDPAPGLASVTPLDAASDRVDQDDVDAPDSGRDLDQEAVTLNGVKAARAAMQAARAAGRTTPSTKHQHRPYLPPRVRVPRSDRAAAEDTDCEHDK